MLIQSSLYREYYCISQNTGFRDLNCMFKHTHSQTHILLMLVQSHCRHRAISWSLSTHRHTTREIQKVNCPWLHFTRYIWYTVQNYTSVLSHREPSWIWDFVLLQSRCSSSYKRNSAQEIRLRSNEWCDTTSAIYRNGNCMKCRTVQKKSDNQRHRWMTHWTQVKGACKNLRWQSWHG